MGILEYVEVTSPVTARLSGRVMDANCTKAYSLGFCSDLHEIFAMRVCTCKCISLVILEIITWPRHIIVRCNNDISP
ncbi:hypothetical protein CEXT_533661 [Caerostris extrusa]|uniref:Uncharacterized protein n=1 Tax=Caerostris extrusa TaxID=172846 RepID=A0AAV4NPQ4_CAEEX|nr:hypothetical protein CEXT_533661 [Caerostris extrusa]